MFNPENKNKKVSDIVPKDKSGFKVTWKEFKKLYHTCELNGKESSECKKKTEDLGIDWIKED